ncbi:MAG TPA: hypothetical protein VFA04_03470 [Bryobacteraceae bacterium]|nr:hypothetical protein [Bryobacteraceae bacterium]
MLPEKLLVKERVVHDDGFGPVIELDDETSKLLVLTLGITRAVERESLEVAVWGSEDGQDWGSKPLVKYPQKFYCGLYSTLLNLSAHPKVRYLRVGWKVERFPGRDSAPMFGFYLYVQESGARLSPAQVTLPAAALAYA